MCLVVAIILGIFAFNAYAAQKFLLGSLALAGALFFIVLMIRNILHVRKRKYDEK